MFELLSFALPLAVVPAALAFWSQEIGEQVASLPTRRDDAAAAADHQWD